VPDAPAAFTSEKGWDLTVDQMQLLRPVIASLRQLKSRVILFMDPDPTVVDRRDPSRGRRHRDLHRRLCCRLPRPTTCRHA
jgi:pyridoxine 5'-phosphate synthase PdxJ